VINSEIVIKHVVMN